MGYQDRFMCCEGKVEIHRLDLMHNEISCCYTLQIKYQYENVISKKLPRILLYFMRRLAVGDSEDGEGVLHKQCKDIEHDMHIRH